MIPPHTTIAEGAFRAGLLFHVRLPALSNLLPLAVPALALVLGPTTRDRNC